MRDSIVLLTVFHAGGIIYGMTRLQKILFIVQHEVRLGNFSFTPCRFGFYSHEVNDVVNSLEKHGFLKVEKKLSYSSLQENPLQIISLTYKGRNMAMKLASNLDDVRLLKMKIITPMFARAPIVYLIAYICSRYPNILQ